MKKNRKVIHIIADLGNGGAERQLVELLKSNPSHGLIILKNAGIYRKDLDKFKVSYKELNVKTYFEAVICSYKISKIIKKANCKIGHAWMYNSCLLITLVKLLFYARLKVIWSIRCSNMNLKFYSVFLLIVFKN